jgi:endo-alpha-N-acetylgalactosaminidase
MERALKKQTWISATAALALLIPSTFIPQAAAAEPTPAGNAIAASQLAASATTETGGYGPANAVDGKLDGSNWTSAGSNANPATPPQDLVIDTHLNTKLAANTPQITGFNYQTNPQCNGSIYEYAVYASDSKYEPTTDAGWGTPVATGDFTKGAYKGKAGTGSAAYEQCPAGAKPDTRQEDHYVIFDTPVQARWLKLSALSFQANASVSELTIYATGDQTPVVDLPGDPTTVALTSPDGTLSINVAKEFPQVIDYTLNGKMIAGAPKVIDTVKINGKTVPVDVTYVGSAASHANWDVKLFGLDATLATEIAVRNGGVVTFSIVQIAGGYAASINTIEFPNLSLLSVDSTMPNAQIRRAVTGSSAGVSSAAGADPDSTITLSTATAVEAGPKGSNMAVISNDQISASIMSNAIPDNDSDNWDNAVTSQVVDDTSAPGEKRIQLQPGQFTYHPSGLPTQASIASLDDGSGKVADPDVAVYELPTVKVVLATDANADGTVDWQDGAIAYRNNMTTPLGAERTAERVVQRIPFNFGSTATNPFELGLENTKRIYNNTDGLGQMMLQKGYANEGHDSGHPDYGGDYNIRAGGLSDFNTLIEEAKTLNTDTFIHVNATEAHQEANNFSEFLVQGQKPNWDWVSPAFFINQRNDVGSGNLQARFAQLKSEAPDLAGVYIDTYYSGGWVAQEMLNALKDLKIQVGSEWSYSLQTSELFSHWSLDKNYGGNTNKGLRSQLIRFVNNENKDTWNDEITNTANNANMAIEPLGGARVVDFEGWTGHHDYLLTDPTKQSFTNAIWNYNLPTKFLQHYSVMDWDAGTTSTPTTVKLSGDKTAITVTCPPAPTDARACAVATTQADARTISMDNVPVLYHYEAGAAGTAASKTYKVNYLLPWGDQDPTTNTSSPSAATKMYYWDSTINDRSVRTTTWTLTKPFDNASGFAIYELTDAGRAVDPSASVSLSGNQLSVTAKANTAYIVVPTGTKTVTAATYGNANLVNPGFNAGTTGWNPTGDVTASLNKRGDNVAIFGDAASSISQKATGLTAGTNYTFSANIELSDGAERQITVDAEGSAQPRVFSITPAWNYIAADSKASSYSQRVWVNFTAPADTATVSITAVAGAGTTVTIDDARIQQLDDYRVPDANRLDDQGNRVDYSVSAPPKIGEGQQLVAWETFETNQPGYGVFYHGEAGGTSDHNEVMTYRHDPYTAIVGPGNKNTRSPFRAGDSMAGQAVNDVIDGDHSLRSHKADSGLLFRTTQATVPMQQGHDYRIEFDYATNLDNTFNLVAGTDTVDPTNGYTQTTDRTMPLTKTIEPKHFTAQLSPSSDYTWIGFSKTANGGVSGSDLIIDNLSIIDLGDCSTGNTCYATGDASATDPGTVPKGHQANFKVTFKNNSHADASNVQIALTDVPQGWNFLVDAPAQGADHTDLVAPGDSFATGFNVQVPTNAQAGLYVVGYTVTYFDGCMTRTATGTVTVRVTADAVVNPNTMTASADSQQASSGSEGPASNVLDGNPSTIWHTNWTVNVGTILPHVLTLKFSGTEQVSGFMYQSRQSGGNGRVGDYQIQISDQDNPLNPTKSSGSKVESNKIGDVTDDGSWKLVAKGTFSTSTTAEQKVDFGATYAAKYLRMVQLTAPIGDNTFGSAAEVRVYGVASSPTPITGVQPTTRTADTQGQCTPNPVTPPAPSSRWQANDNGYEKTEGGDLTFIIDKGYELYQSVSVDGEPLVKGTQHQVSGQVTPYAAAMSGIGAQALTGRTEVRLLNAYLGTLATGDHSIVVTYSDGQQATHTFTVTDKSQTPGGGSGEGNGGSGDSGGSGDGDKGGGAGGGSDNGTGGNANADMPHSGAPGSVLTGWSLLAFLVALGIPLIGLFRKTHRA